MAPPSGNICGSIICSRKLSVLDAAELPGNRCQQGHYQKNQGNITLFNYKYNQNEGGRSSTAFCLSEHPWAEVRSEDRSVQRISANKYDPKGVVRITSGLEGRSHKEQVKAPDIGPKLQEGIWLLSEDYPEAQQAAKSQHSLCDLQDPTYCWNTLQGRNSVGNYLYHTPSKWSTLPPETGLPMIADVLDKSLVLT